MRSTTELDGHRLPLVGVGLGEQSFDVSAHGNHADGVGIHLAEDGAKSANATGFSQTASALIHDRAMGNDGANLAFDLFDLFVGDGVGVGEIKPEFGSGNFASLLVAVGADVSAKSEVEHLAAALAAAAAAAAAQAADCVHVSWCD